MSRHRLTLIAAIGAGLLAAGALTGCATAASTQGSTPASSSTPDAEGTASADSIQVGWLEGGAAIALVTLGSSSCPPVVEGEPSVEGTTLTVVLADSPRTTCTRDMAPRATLVSVPTGVDPTAGLAVRVTGVAEGAAMLPGLAAASASPEQFTSSAGWVGRDLLAVLTYGSSGCPPVVESVTAAGSELAVQFATPPADRICTMDLAPRVTVADVTGVAGPDVTSVALSGGGVEAPEPIAILGSR